jgi:hypothetical protein
MQYHSDSEWDKSDLFFLSNSLRHGMPVDRVASFLSRPASEVRAKARELKVSFADEGLDVVVPLRPRKVI